MNFNKTPMFVDTKLNCQKNAYMSQYDLMIQSLVYTDTDILNNRNNAINNQINRFSVFFSKLLF